MAYSRMVEEIKLKTEEKDKLHDLIGDYSDDDEATTYMITQYRK